MEGREEKTCITIQILIPAPDRTFIASNLLSRWNINPVMEWLKLTVPKSPKSSLIVSFWIMRFGKFLIPVDCLCLILGFLAWWNDIDLTWNWQGRKCHTFWLLNALNIKYYKMELAILWRQSKRNGMVLLLFHQNWPKMQYVLCNWLATKLDLYCILRFHIKNYIFLKQLRQKQKCWCFYYSQWYVFQNIFVQNFL